MQDFFCHPFALDGAKGDPGLRRDDVSMAGRRILLWRHTFLRALARTGNVRASAFEAGWNAGWLIIRGSE